MKIGLLTDALGDLALGPALDWILEHGIEAAEIATGGFSPAPHCDLQELLNSEESRSDFLGSFASCGLILSALNCNSNPLDPYPERGWKARDNPTETIDLAAKLGLDTVVAMSGCPEDPSGSPYPN